MPELRARLRGIFTGYATAWFFLIGVTAAEIIYAALPSHDQAAVLQWASTNVHNLRHDPVGCLIASAFFPAGSAGSWPFLIALAIFGANHVLGNWRTALVCAAGHVIGTLLSEGILGYRIAHGLRPAWWASCSAPGWPAPPRRSIWRCWYSRAASLPASPGSTWPPSVT